MRPVSLNNFFRIVIVCRTFMRCRSVSARSEPQKSPVVIAANASHPLTVKSSVLAAGQFDMSFVAIPGRVQIYFLNYYRREEDLASYEMDSVSAAACEPT
jgi:hypothetical protein